MSDVQILNRERLNAVKEAGLKPMYRTRTAIVYNRAEINAVLEKKAVVTRQSEAEWFTSAEFRQEVIAELMAGGDSLERATNRTRDQVRLFNEARELGLM